jgi:hypothetical protein
MADTFLPRLLLRVRHFALGVAIGSGVSFVAFLLTR